MLTASPNVDTQVGQGMIWDFTGIHSGRLEKPAIGNTALNQSPFHFSTSIKLIACQLGGGIKKLLQTNLTLNSIIRIGGRRNGF